MSTEDRSSNWLIVGLGNPGIEYERTRHNLGFMAVDVLASEYGVQIKRIECGALIGRVEIAGSAVELVKPQTFMNLSGDAVKCLLQKGGRSHQRLIVISDDLALPFGKLRIRPHGSHGGQNGLRSIIDRLGTNAFIRLRIGIQPEHPVANARNFVLERFSKGEAELVGEILQRTADAARTVISDGVDRTMAEFN